jgi:hypothetical protein
MLDASKSHRTEVQDTEGPRDEGIDVQLYYDEYGQHRQVALQIKSFVEIARYPSARLSRSARRSPAMAMRYSAIEPACARYSAVGKYGPLPEPMGSA